MSALLPYAPLDAELRRRGLTAKDMERGSGLNRDRLKKRGLTLANVDRVTYWLGLHPIEIWGDDYLAAAS